MRFDADARPEPQALAGMMAAAPASLTKSLRVNAERELELDCRFFIIVSEYLFVGLRLSRGPQNGGMQNA
jgi:hypothetical protein